MLGCYDKQALAKCVFIILYTQFCYSAKACLSDYFFTVCSNEDLINHIQQGWHHGALPGLFYVGYI